ncbi:glutathione S-transferase U17 [Cajanus cajan]|uniref:Glutathione S-transferase n=1 Tax=Cajanus cajan TaxID=3821 RepID=A0A151TFX4_CAJCA|nr:glutathione S-transferase U17 [Cajanus cajan]KYP65952.1 putative glutathione S-transferase GSTU6 [Cajanus cajan]
MAKNDLKLLGGWFSPFALRVQVALNLKGLDYEVVEQTLSPKSELLLKSNPVHKKIPVLLHADHKPICESLIIVEYIDEVWTNAPSILPQKPYDRANARFWLSYIDDKLLTSTKSILMAEDDEAKKPHLEQIEEVLEKMEEVFNKYSEGKAFFGGDTIGLIDIGFGSFMSWIRVTEDIIGIKVLDEARNPSLAQWAQSFAAHPSVKGLLPETPKLTEFAKLLILQWTASAR